MKFKIKITDKQTVFIIDNIDLIEDEERQHRITQKLDKMSKREASEIIKEIIEYQDFLESVVDGYSYDHFFYKD